MFHSFGKQCTEQEFRTTTQLTLISKKYQIAPIMSYRKYKKLKTVTQAFALSAQREKLFIAIKPIEPSVWLAETLSISELLPLTNEKAKAERVISPILSEIARFYVDKISFFSGEDLNVNEDLSGECDFFFTLVPKSAYLESPMVSLVEAKDEDMEYGIAQCAAQLYGAKLFNESEGKNIPFLYGCATDGVEWRFIRFENNTFYVDTKVYTDLKEILGVWHYIIQLYV
jgi:hypothetical protein